MYRPLSTTSFGQHKVQVYEEVDVTQQQACAYHASCSCGVWEAFASSKQADDWTVAHITGWRTTP